MMWFILFVLFASANAGEQPCNDGFSVDISDGITYGDGAVEFDGIHYPSNYVYKKNISGEFRTFGCLCKIKNCFRKCCPLGTVMVNKKCTEAKHLDLVQNNGLDIFYTYSFSKHVNVNESELSFVDGRPMGSCYIEDEMPWYVQEDGTLYVESKTLSPPWLNLGPDQYCIDVFLTNTSDASSDLNALICYPNEVNYATYVISSTCMLISCFFILLTVAVYAWLPELHNLHGMVLKAYLLSFFVGFVFMASMQIQLSLKSMTPTECIVFTFIIYFSILAAFFWLNVMCFDIWWTFSGKHTSTRPSAVRKRFLQYCLYALGVPSLLTALVAGLEFSDIPRRHFLLPNIRRQGCFITGNSKLLYLYGPIVVLCMVNLIFFILTALKIYGIKSQTKKMLQSTESNTTDAHRKDKQRFSLYIKLFAVMGVNWILEVVSSIYPQAQYIWQFTDAYNVLVGLIIFIIFVCKKKTMKLIQKRFKDKLRKSKSESEEMGEVTNKHVTQWKHSPAMRASTETIKTILNADIDTKSVKSNSERL